MGRFPSDRPAGGLTGELGASLAGPALALAVLLGRLLLPPGADRSFVVPLLFLAVSIGAVFGGRWSAVATASLAALGLFASTDGVSFANVLSIVVAVAIALTTGELRARAERAERATDLAHTRLRRLTLRDALTGLLDRRGLDYAVGIELARGSRRGGHFALVLLAVSPLANVNERVGRAVMDTLLQVFADSLEQRIRQSDIAARVSDYEFGVILPDTDHGGADLVAREVIANFNANLNGILPEDATFKVRFGIAHFPDDGRATDDLFNAASARVTAADLV